MSELGFILIFLGSYVIGVTLARLGIWWWSNR